MKRFGIYMVVGLFAGLALGFAMFILAYYFLGPILERTGGGDPGWFAQVILTCCIFAPFYGPLLGLLLGSISATYANIKTEAKRNSTRPPRARRAKDKIL